jgi:hypothetical protein
LIFPGGGGGGGEVLEPRFKFKALLEKLTQNLEFSINSVLLKHFKVIGGFEDL